MSNYNFFKKHLESLPHGVLLDLGAGPQHFKELTSRFSIVAVDAVPIHGIDVVCDISKPLPFKDGSFDVVFLSNVLEHIYDPFGLIKEADRVLKSGGTLVCTVPFLMSSHQRPHDYFRYTDIALQKMFCEYFDNVHVEAVGSPLHVVHSILHKYLANFDSSFMNRIKKKIVRTVHSFHSFLCLYFFPNSRSNLSFTEGYGIVAKKRS